MAGDNNDENSNDRQGGLTVGPAIVVANLDPNPDPDPDTNTAPTPPGTMKLNFGFESGLRIPRRCTFVSIAVVLLLLLGIVVFMLAPSHQHRHANQDSESSPLSRPTYKPWTSFTSTTSSSPYASYTSSNPFHGSARSRAKATSTPKSGSNSNSGSKSRQRQSQNRGKRQKPKTHYEVLGLDVQATEEDVKSAYRHLLRKYHPDKARYNKKSSSSSFSSSNSEKEKTDTTALLDRIRHAHDVLSTHQRCHYDYIQVHGSWTLRSACLKRWEAELERARQAQIQKEREEEEKKRERERKEEREKKRAEEKRKIDACQGKLMGDAADCLGKYIRPSSLRGFHWLARLVCWWWVRVGRYV